jgi:hypothetical protein
MLYIYIYIYIYTYNYTAYARNEEWGDKNLGNKLKIKEIKDI